MLSEGPLIFTYHASPQTLSARGNMNTEDGAREDDLCGVRGSGACARAHGAFPLQLAGAIAVAELEVPAAPPIAPADG